MSDTRIKHSFLKRDNDSILFSGEGEFIFYVPEYFFETKNAVIIGEYVNILGILNYTIETNGKNIGLKTFKFPSVLLTKPYAIEKVKNIKLIKNSEEQDYRLLKYKEGDQIIVSTKVPNDIKNVEDFYQMFLITGKIPTTIPYNELQKYYLKTMEVNGSKYGVNIQLFGIVISEQCRDPKDLSKPFRLSNEKDMTNYLPVSIKTIPKYISPYTAITSENWDEALVSAIMAKDGEESPMEKIIMA